MFMKPVSVKSNKVYICASIVILFTTRIEDFQDFFYLEDLTRVVISYEIYETILRRVS